MNRDREPITGRRQRLAERFHQALLIGSIVPLSWLGMMLVHEAGHVAGAWATGGQVARVVFHPLTISRTDLADNPRPLLVAWAGPLLGTAAPLGVWAAVRGVRAPGEYLLRFFAGFCLVANGCYLAGGSLDGVGDAGDLLRHGAPHWQLWLFGIATIPAGFWLWHGLGSRFGLGKSPERVEPWAAYLTFALLMLTIALGSLSSGGRGAV